MTIRELTGHTSPETAYLVPDYPYGRKVRCRIRYWIEFGPTKGYRHVSQTEHPTRKTWNAPKRSTYSLLAGALYLDESDGHVHFAALSEHSEAVDVERFALNFPITAAQPTGLGRSAPTLAAWCECKAAYYTRVIAGAVRWICNGAEIPYSETDRLRDTVQRDAWIHAGHVCQSTRAARSQGAA